MKHSIAVALLLIVSGCGHTRRAAPFLICNCSEPISPIRILIQHEKDLVGGYEEKLAFFDQRPLSDHIRILLQSRTVDVLVRTENTRRSYTPKPRPNPVELVDDPKDADFCVSLGVDQFAYEEARSVGDRLLGAHFLGIGGIGEDAPSGIVGATCNVKLQSQRNNMASLEFDIIGVSDRNLSKEDAYRQALERAARAFIFQLLKTSEGGLDRLHWTANNRLQQAGAE